MVTRSCLLIACCLFLSCKQRPDEDQSLFTLLEPAETHIDFKNQITETEENNIIEYLYFNNGAGVAVGDINNDGLIDLYFTANQLPNRLYLNKGHLIFEDITEKAGVAGEGDWKTGVSMDDVNGDGFLDVYVCQVGDYKTFQGENQLFINQGDLTFKEEAQDYSIDFKGFSTQAAFFDYDADGDLDMYLLNHSVHAARNYGRMELRYEEDLRAGDKLFSNEQEGDRRIFREVTREAGILSSPIGYGLGVNISDINNDGYPDIYVSNDFHEDDYLYVNNGDGTFTERLKESIAHTSRSSMGNDIGDINNDGLQDIVVLDMLPDVDKIRKQSGGEDDYELSEIKLSYGYHPQFVRNTLQLNLGGGLFSEIGQLAGVYATDWSWSPLFCDVDNDGWKDLFITSGIFRRANDLDYIKFLTGGNRYNPEKDNSNLQDHELYEKMPLYPNVNYIYRNNADLTFTNMGNEWGINDRAYSNGSAYADLDNDGDLELIVNNINSSACIYRNNASEKGGKHYVHVKLLGNDLNSRGTGARVTVFAGGMKQIADQFTTHGFISGSSDVLHFGLGTATVIDSIIVRWPDFSEQKAMGIPVDTILHLDIRNASKPAERRIAELPGLFAKVGIPGLECTHIEDDYVDYYREKLIPHGLSAEGPALVTRDVNGDRLDDIFVGAAKGRHAEILIQQKGGSFKSMSLELAEDQFSDVVDAIFFDADRDGDPDLYIVRGGNEVPPGNAGLKDNLLLNNGKGLFSNAHGYIPPSHNGSCVRPADFDGDGDIDLFLGSRSIPGAYGLSPEQFLLENDGKGSFSNVTLTHTGGLKNIGMVTDAAWMDYDGDGDPDLLIAGEWMTIRLFRNDHGHFTDATHEAALDETSGWWNCLEVIDIDGDGDEDIIGGNMGLNSLLKASVKEPVELFLNDFDNNGTPDPVICSYQEGISYPVASLDELAAQISGLDKKFPNYADFGGKTMFDIFGTEVMRQSVRKKAELFESCLFLNTGKGIFKTIKLPLLAQFSQVRDILADDFDSDGKKDLLLIGNNYHVRPSYGRYDASYGWYLSGLPDKVSFTPHLPVESGFVLKGDARRIVPVTIAGKRYLVAVVNSGELQVFQLNQ